MELIFTMTRFHRFLLIWFTLGTTATCSNGESTATNQELSYRLPNTMFPTSYRVDIITNLADYNKNYTFEGKVWITIKVLKQTNRIVLHSKNLDIDEQEVTVLLDKNAHDTGGKNRLICENGCNGYEKIPVIDHCYHDDYEFYIINTGEVLQPQHVYVLYIPYRGELTQGLEGYYRSSYKDLETGTTRWLAVTQFESTDARRAFPCFDEPAFKAVFQINLGHVEHRSSISNMPKMSTVPIENMEGWVWDRFGVTVAMSTYLVAFVVSDFSFRVSPPTGNNVHFRVWARSDAINQVDYAAIIGPKVLQYFETYFNVRYPLPKMDMIAIPDFNAGAMENWGLITYREVAVLYDPKISTASSQPYVASVIAHELAHQWFGNLVTMKWWTDLWLNEGFATYVAALGVQHLHPEWKAYDEEVVDNMMSVMALDALRSSHPISVPIGHPREIAQIFDTISYKKGFYVLRMMNLFLGEETFTRGVTHYLKLHAYGNAEQDDLWASLTDQAHKDNVLPREMSVKEIMDSWTLQTGYPLLTVERNYEDCSATITQERFLADRSCSDDEAEDPTRWWIPLRYTWASDRNFSETRPQMWLSSKDKSITATGLPCRDWVVFNVQVGGLYRVKYDIENWRKLKDALTQRPLDIALLNRVQIIDDSMELAKTADIPYDLSFGILKYLSHEKEYLPWKTAIRNLGYIDKMLRFTSVYGYFRSYMQNLLQDIYFELISKKYSNTPENLSKIKFQSLIAAWACKFEVGNCREKSVAAFYTWMSKQDPDTDNPIPKDSRSYVYCTAIKFGGEKEWNFLWNRFLKSNVGNEKSLILSALSCSREVWILNRYLDWSLNEKSGIRKQDSTSVFANIARGNIGYSLAKKFLMNRIHDIFNHFGPKSIRLGTYVSMIANQITTSSEYDELAAFVKKNEKSLRPSMQAVKQGLENAKINVDWHKKFYKKVSAYFVQEAINGFADEQED